LKVQRRVQRQAWEEILVAFSAACAMALALTATLAAQNRLPQVGFNFFMVAVGAYVLRDRAKDVMRSFLGKYLSKFLYERTTRIVDPVTQDDVGVCSERVDYNSAVVVPEDIASLRAKDDLVMVAQGELAETVIRYRKKIVLASEMLPRLGDGLVSGVTDIIRLNIGRLLHDMDDPEYALEYVDIDDYSVGRLQLAKRYRVDVAFRFMVDDGNTKQTTVQLIRFVLDRDGIKRMSELSPETLVTRPIPVPVRAA
jgi:hypothetical protein